MLAYLAAPMDFVSGQAVTRTRAREALVSVGFAVFDPSRPYDAAMKDAAAVAAINEFALDRADAVLALIPTGVTSVGVPMEIQRAWDAGIPVATIGGSQSLQLASMDGIEVFSRGDEAAAAMLLSARANEARNRFALKWVGPERCAPKRAYPGDAGLDLVCSESRHIGYGEWCDVPCGVRVELPPGTWGRIVGRSSTLRNRKLLVAEGIIDNGWRGELFAGVQNLGEKATEVKVGDRIAQLIVQPLMSAPAVRVEELSESIRGTRGFGSSGE